MSGSVFRVVAPVLAVCAAFAALPRVRTKRQKTGHCADVRGRCKNEIGGKNVNGIIL